MKSAAQFGVASIDCTRMTIITSTGAVPIFAFSIDTTLSFQAGSTNFTACIRTTFNVITRGHANALVINALFRFSAHPAVRTASIRSTIPILAVRNTQAGTIIQTNFIVPASATQTVLYRATDSIATGGIAVFVGYFAFPFIVAGANCTFTAITIKGLATFQAFTNQTAGVINHTDTDFATGLA